MVQLRRRRPDRGPELTPWGFYAVTPTRRRRDPLRALAVGAVLTLVLAFGGCIVAVGSVAQDFGSTWSVTGAPVAAATQRQVAVGQAFALAGFRAAPGWTLDREELGGPTISGLRVTNAAGVATELRLAFTFRRGSTWLAEVDCSCPSVSPGTTAAMTCSSTTARLPLGYDAVVVADSF